MDRASASERPSSPAADNAQRRWGVRANIATAPATPPDVDNESLLAFSSEDDRPVEPPPPPPVAAAASADGVSSNKTWMAVAAGIAAVSIAVVAAWSLLARVPRTTVPELGKLSLTSNPVGARVIVDGADRGTTPFSTALSPGTHTIVLRQGDEEKTVPLTVTAGEQVSQYFEFAASHPPPPPSGKLSIATDHPGARVTVDGKSAGATPILLADLPPGDHTVAVATDAGTLERKVKVDAGATTSVVFSAAQGAATSAGWLAVSAPFELQIFQDNELVGSSATSKIMMAAGRHDVRLVNAALGFEEARRIDVAAGKTNAIKIAAPSVPVSINARPWADVLVDGSPIGQTPLANVSLAIGSHQITFRHPQLGERRQTAVVTVNGPNRVSADLTKQ